MIGKVLFGVLLSVALTTQHGNNVYPPGVPPPDQQHIHRAPENQQYQQGQQQQAQQGQNQQYQGQNQQYQAQNQQYQGQQQQNMQYQQGQGGQQQYQGGPPQGGQQNTQQFQQQPPQPPSHDHGHGDFNQRENVHNTEHIKEHLKEVVDKPEKEMTDDELEFHYFKLHDYDGNNKLDGVEVTKAITHFHDDHKSTSGNSTQESGGENAPPPKVYTDDELINIIDMVMKEDDLNDDGYIEYFEFVTAQRKAKEDSNKKN